MVSVIVPIYNVEQYLKKCIDSIIFQTYKDIEIILVDDGSTDGCGKICDSYTDCRITVYHTENRGLSAARNFGIEKTHGDYLYFIDSDDWIDKELIENAVKRIGNADVVYFSKKECSFTGEEALVALAKGEISDVVWDKMYRRDCFSKTRFPEGRIFEDIATIYKVLYESNLVICADIQGYHHLIRKDSLGHTHNLKNLFDYYLSVTEQYNYCINVFQDVLSYSELKETQISLLRKRAFVIARAWGWRNTNPSSDSRMWEMMSSEARTMYPYYVRKHFPLRIRGGIFLARFNHPFSFWLANKLHMLTRKHLC